MEEHTNAYLGHCGGSPTPLPQFHISPNHSGQDQAMAGRPTVFYTITKEARLIIETGGT